MSERASPIAAYRDRTGADGSDGGRRVRISEVCGGYLAQVDAFRGREVEVAERLAMAAGAVLPPLQHTVDAGGTRLYALAPGQSWWRAATEAPLRALAAELPAALGSVTLLSASRARFAVSGEGARELLARGIALDLDPREFVVGRCALTGLHHTPVLIERSAADRYEIHALRTYAASIYEWLLDAAQPLGFDLVTEEEAGAP